MDRKGNNKEWRWSEDPASIRPGKVYPASSHVAKILLSHCKGVNQLWYTRKSSSSFIYGTLICSHTISGLSRFTTYNYLVEISKTKESVHIFLSFSTAWWSWLMLSDERKDRIMEVCNTISIWIGIQISQRLLKSLITPFLELTINRYLFTLRCAFVWFLF